MPKENEVRIAFIKNNGHLEINRRNKGKEYSITISVEGVVSSQVSMLLTKQNLTYLLKQIGEELNGRDAKGE